MAQGRIRKHIRDSDAYAFFNLLTGPVLFEQVEALLPPHRERLFPPTETLAMFLAQAFSADRYSQKAVNDTAVRRVVASLPVCSTHTEAYCRARERYTCTTVRVELQTDCYAGVWGHHAGSMNQLDSGDIAEARR